MGHYASEMSDKWRNDVQIISEYQVRCPICAAIIEKNQAEKHAEWHRKLGA